MSVVMNAKQLVEYLSKHNQLTNVMREACALYGMELVLTDKHTVSLARTPEHVLGFHIGWLLSQTHVAKNKWYDYNVTFRLDDVAVDIAVEGLQETHSVNPT